MLMSTSFFVEILYYSLEAFYPYKFILRNFLCLSLPNPELIEVFCKRVVFCMMLGMWSEGVTFIILISSRVSILLGSFSKFKIFRISSACRISCPVFRMTSENVYFRVEMAKSFLCSLLVQSDFKIPLFSV
jgi:hypothetical protein